MFLFCISKIIHRIESVYLDNLRVKDHAKARKEILTLPSPIMPLKCLTSLESGKECWIGRGTGSDIVTPHCSISSKHCFLSLQLIPAGNAIDTTEDKTAINDSEEPVELSQPEGEDPLIRTRYIVQCTVTDHSSNGMCVCGWDQQMG